MGIHHGGNLLAAISTYGGNIDQWLDLSTGVSPFTYPVPAIPTHVWNRLPQDNDGLESAAQGYYGTAVEPLAVAGSQAAIMQLPKLLTQVLGHCGRVCLPRVGYKEHQHAWQSFALNGQRWGVDFYDDLPSQAQIEQSDVVVVINPNNPTGKLHRVDQLRQIHAQLSTKQGYLVVDEAFMDCTPEASLLDKDTFPQHLIVLRSVGKFFGLAGSRVGFVFADHVLLHQLSEVLGPWAVAGPSRWVVKSALQDTQWQINTRHKIAKHMARLTLLLEQSLNAETASTDLFITVYLDNAPSIYRQLCEAHIHCRLCDEKNALRFGLPEAQWQWQKLEAALSDIAPQRAKPAQEAACEY
ncbi:threonine-phosphate decarboxylase CobD [Thaumasiovibrio sp. DFM-14]|uniref:threonine-phosphate decarboxylase CobD n=1 Tax=Thaumasiovibrio sp. DFM-14 TaxID=3384792 RepID=UPI0039A1A004